MTVSAEGIFFLHPLSVPCYLSCTRNFFVLVFETLLIDYIFHNVTTTCHYNHGGSDVLNDVSAPGSHELEKSIVPPSSSTASAFRSNANCLMMSRSSQQV